MKVQAVIAPSFSDIFSSNAFKNGIVTVALPEEAIARLMEVAAEEQPITVDLESMTVTTPYQDRYAFTLDPFRRSSLMEGRDEIGLTLQMDGSIAAYEREMAEARPWL